MPEHSITERPVLSEALQNDIKIQVAEILLVFTPAVLIIILAKPFVGQNPILSQSVVWLANIVMLLIVWGGLRIRVQSWSHLGLKLQHSKSRTFLYSIIVFIAALAAFVIGAIIMANIVGIPESADMSGYNYLEGNLPMLIAALVAVFIVSSFGEEVIYRGFLITRISEMGAESRKWTRFAVLISAVIFGLIHFEWGLMGIVQTGFMGLALGISFLMVKRNLWVLILAHAYMDAILMVQMYLGQNM